MSNTEKEKLQKHAEFLGHYQLANRGNLSELTKFQNQGIDTYRKGQNIFTFVALTKGGYYYIAVVADDEGFAKSLVEDTMSDIAYTGIVQLTKLYPKEKLVLTPAEERTLDLNGIIRKYFIGKPHGIDIRVSK